MIGIACCAGWASGQAWLFYIGGGGGGALSGGDWQIFFEVHHVFEEMRGIQLSSLQLIQRDECLPRWELR